MYGHETRSAVDANVLVDAADHSVERSEIGMDLLDVARPLVRRRGCLNERLDELPERRDVDERRADVLDPDARKEGLEPRIVGKGMARTGVEHRGYEVAAVAEHGDVLVDGPGHLRLVAGRQGAG